MLVTETTTQNGNQIMSIVQWPLRQAKFANSSLTLANIIEFLCAHCIIESKDVVKVSKKPHIELFDKC